jgi:hypothetical protein
MFDAELFMGMERIVQFSDAGPTWPAIREHLAAAGIAVQMRMIDNLPAFPDEEPPSDWRDLRVSLRGGMITMRREPGQIRVIVWGNADEGLRRDQEALANACMTAGGGIVT